MEDTVAEMLRSRVEELFEKSDMESKGFIVKRDMQRMRDEVPLTPEQLEDVFDSLDVRNNGYLTVDQFLCGFGNYLTGSNTMTSTLPLRRPDQPQNTILTPCDSFEDQYQVLIEQLRETEALDNLDVLRRLCDDVNLYGSQEIQAHLELFLRQVAHDVTRQSQQQRGLEHAMRTRRDQDELQVRRLFEEMEQHLREEKQKMVTQVEQRVRSVRQQMEAEVVDKEDALKEATLEKHQIALRLRTAKLKENALRQENARLAEEKGGLEQQCERQAREITRLTHRLDQQQADDQRQYMTEGYRLAKRISIETQGLLQQLDLLNEIADTLENFKSAEDSPANGLKTH